jgi:hypothetical protein
MLCIAAITMILGLLHDKHGGFVDAFVNFASGCGNPLDIALNFL